MLSTRSSCCEVRVQRHLQKMNLVLGTAKVTIEWAACEISGMVGGDSIGNITASSTALLELNGHGLCWARPGRWQFQRCQNSHVSVNLCVFLCYFGFSFSDLFLFFPPIRPYCRHLLLFIWQHRPSILYTCVMRNAIPRWNEIIIIMTYLHLNSSVTGQAYIPVDMRWNRMCFRKRS